MTRSATGSVRVEYRYVDGYHIFTSEDVYGLYVASRDAGRAFEDVAPALQELIRLNEGITCRVEKTLTFSEFVDTIRHGAEQLPPKMVSRPFLIHAAA